MPRYYQAHVGSKIYKDEVVIHLEDLVVLTSFLASTITIDLGITSGVSCLVASYERYLTLGPGEGRSTLGYRSRRQRLLKAVNYLPSM